MSHPVQTQKQEPEKSKFRIVIELKPIATLNRVAAGLQKYLRNLETMGLIEKGATLGLHREFAITEIIYDMEAPNWGER